MDVQKPIDPEQIRTAWNALSQPGEIREVCVFHNGRPARVGYFDNPSDVIDELDSLDFAWDATYWTINATPNKLCTNTLRSVRVVTTD